MNVAELAAELSGGAFGDERLNRRAGKLAELLARYPNLSIPAALKSRADIEAAYRFFDNDAVTPDRIIQGHLDATLQRISLCDFVLLVQDTTEIDLTRPQQQVTGAGPMDHESRRGAFFHPLMAFDSAGVPLGFVGQKSWTREKIRHAGDMSESQQVEQRRKTPIEEKESFRWLEGFRRSEMAAKICYETTIVCVGDSESDIYDLFAESDASEYSNLHLLIRAGQKRNTTEGPDWGDLVRSTEVIGHQTVQVRARLAKTHASRSARTRPREARTAELDIRKSTIELRRPVNGRSSLPKSLNVNIVLCEEPHPPAGAEAISWMLVTTLPIATAEDVQRVISSYCVRWQIEVYFRTLKSGCRIEERRFEAIDRVLNALAFFSVIAWRVMYVCHLGRECPDLDCEVIFEPSEWKSVYSILREPIPAAGCPPLNDVVRAIARLGGFINRTNQQPGPQSLWIGLQRTYDLANAWLTFGPDAKTKPTR